MLITETTSTTTPNNLDDDDDDDEISFLYSNPPSINKGKSIQIDNPLNDDDDDEIQLLFSTSYNRSKKRKSFIHGNDEAVLLFGSSSKGIQETPFENNQLKLKNQEIIDLDSEEIMDFIEKDDLVKKFGVDYDSGDLSLLVCDICADEKPKIGFLCVMGCDHSYCFECIGKYVASRLQENVVEISCPVVECEGVLGPEYCREILPAEVYDRWGLVLCEEVINPGQKFYCPYKDCSALMIDDSEENGEVIRRMECPNCRRMFCVKCKVAWHEGVECEEFQMLNEGERGREDVMLVNLAKKNMWKRCPRCKMYVQRSEGCNSMMCRCGCRFCYACGSSFGTCLCRHGNAHHLPGTGALRAMNAMNLAWQIGAMNPQGNPPLDNSSVNQTPTNPPIQLRQAMLDQHRLLQRQNDLLNLSASQTQLNPSVQLQQGPLEGSFSTSQARQQQLELMRSQITLHNRLANQTQFNPSIQRPQQGPVGGGLNIALVRQHIRQNLSADQTQSNPSVDLLQQGPVGGRFSISLVRQQLLQNRSANQSQSNNSVDLLQQGPVGVGIDTSQARQQLDLMRSESQAFQARQLERIQFEMRNRLPYLLANQTRPNATIQPLGSSVARTNEFIQASPGLPMTSSHVVPMENLSTSETQFLLESSTRNHARCRRQV